MLYIDEQDLKALGVRWQSAIDVVASAVELMSAGDFSQPLKPYLRFKDRGNRIIAMPAYLGGTISLAGIKWIASYPGNLEIGLPRAHSVTILNDSSTGKPVCIINTALISIIRTSAVSGFVIREYLKVKGKRRTYDVGIVGFGPIGQYHLEVIYAVAGDAIGDVYIYDLRDVDLSKVPTGLKDRVYVSHSWEEPFGKGDIFLTATVSQSPYVTGMPRPGSLLLNISLRDFRPEIIRYVNKIIVDDWTEVCRENTDIENMSRHYGLTEDKTYSLLNLKLSNPFDGLRPEEVVMFNPMGMAAFDVAIGGYYYQEALRNKIGILLDSQA
jgi:2,3-diaminopropionate biosynthesis protein SbnB